MKKRLIIFLFLFVGLTILYAQEMNADKTGIEETALNYIEGWYEGNADRMDKALHPDLAKRGIQVLPTGKVILGYASKLSMVEYTRAGFGKLPEENRNIEVTILDMLGNMASVKIVSVKFIDYIQMAKCEGEWKIVNVLWEPVKKQ